MDQTRFVLGTFDAGAGAYPGWRADIPMMGTDWLRAKSFPTFFPTGPWLVPARFVPNPLDLGIRLSLNGTIMQKDNTVQRTRCVRANG